MIRESYWEAENKELRMMMVVTTELSCFYNDTDLTQSALNTLFLTGHEAHCNIRKFTFHYPFLMFCVFMWMCSFRPSCQFLKTLCPSVFDPSSTHWTPRHPVPARWAADRPAVAEDFIFQQHPRESANICDLKLHSCCLHVRLINTYSVASRALLLMQI